METPEEFWSRCCASLGPGLAARGYALRCIGNTPDMVDEILALVLAGEKTATFSLPRLLARDGPLPVPGDFLILTRFTGEAACLVRVEHCELVPFDAVGPRELAAEGADARDPATWRAIHRQYWTPQLAATGEVLDESEPVLVQHFSLLSTAPEQAPGSPRLDSL